MGAIGKPKRVIEVDPRRSKPRSEPAKTVPNRKPVRKREPAKTR